MFLTYLTRHILTAVFLGGFAVAGCLADEHREDTKLSGEGETVIRLSLHGFQTLAFPSPDIDATTDPLFNNASVSAVWLLDRRHAFGVEVGRENILQEFEISLGDADIGYEQNYLAWFYGLVYENTSEAWESAPKVHNFFRITAGGISTGPMLRVSAGLQYDLLKLLSVRLGLDYSSTMYKVDTLWFISQRLGFRFGLDVNI